MAKHRALRRSGAYDELSEPYGARAARRQADACFQLRFARGLRALRDRDRLDAGKRGAFYLLDPVRCGEPRGVCVHLVRAAKARAFVKFKI